MKMAASDYVTRLREKIGKELLLCPAVAAVIPDDLGRILLQEKTSGEGWSLPAGAIEPGETPEQALLREVREETGLVVRPKRILGVFGGTEFRHVYPNGDPVEYTVALYLCAVVRSMEQALDKETRALRYFGKDGLPTLGLPYPIDVLFAHL